MQCACSRSMQARGWNFELYMFPCSAKVTFHPNCRDKLAFIPGGLLPRILSSCTKMKKFVCFSWLYPGHGMFCIFPAPLDMEDEEATHLISLRSCHLRSPGLSQQGQ